MGSGIRRLRFALPPILLVMILMRLVWMQLRTYPLFIEARAAHTLAFLEEDVDEACSYDPSLPRAGSLGLAAGAPRAWLLSPGYAVFGYVGCLAGVVEDRPIIRLNQWLLAGTVLLSVLMTRFVTGSWTVALIVGAMLMSRGRLLAGIGQVSVDFPAMLVVTAWLTAQTHFLRTGAWVSLGLAVSVALLGVALDRSLVGLAFAMPVMLGFGFLYRRRLAGPVMQRFRGARQRLSAWPIAVRDPTTTRSTTYVGRAVNTARWMLGMDPEAPAPPPRPEEERGALFRTLSSPFLMWIYVRKRWLRLSLGWLTIGVTGALLSLAAFAFLGGPGSLAMLWKLAPAVKEQLPQLVDLWSEGLLHNVDLHLMLSAFVLFYCAAQSPAAGLAGFLEASWLTLLALAMTWTMAFVLDGYDFAMAGSVGAGSFSAPLLPRNVSLWFEPAVLSLGAGGIYNLMKVLDTRIAEKG